MQREKEASHALHSMWDHARCTDEYGVFLGPRAANHTRCIFQSQRNWRRVYSKFTKLKIVSPTAMAKRAIDSDNLESLVINRKRDLHSNSGDREICIILTKIGRSPTKSGDFEALDHIDLKRHNSLCGKKNLKSCILILNSQLLHHNWCNNTILGIPNTSKIYTKPTIIQSQFLQ